MKYKQYLIYDESCPPSLSETQYADIIAKIEKRENDIILIITKNRFGESGKEFLLSYQNKPLNLVKVSFTI